MRSWESICADRTLQDLPYKVETNRYDQVIMSPASSWRGGYEYEIGKLIEQRISGGRVIVECAIDTSDGIRVADVVWITKERLRPSRRAFSQPIAPEICVEIVSPSNSHEQMLEKMKLYFAAGAEEVWLCSEEGEMSFFLPGSRAPAQDSLRCPGFPRQIDWE